MTNRDGGVRVSHEQVTQPGQHTQKSKCHCYGKTRCTGSFTSTGCTQCHTTAAVTPAYSIIRQTTPPIGGGGSRVCRRASSHTGAITIMLGGKGTIETCIIHMVSFLSRGGQTHSGGRRCTRVGVCLNQKNRPHQQLGLALPTRPAPKLTREAVTKTIHTLRYECCCHGTTVPISVARKRGQKHDAIVQSYSCQNQLETPPKRDKTLTSRTTKIGKRSNHLPGHNSYFTSPLFNSKGREKTGPAKTVHCAAHLVAHLYSKEGEGARAGLGRCDVGQRKHHVPSGLRLPEGVHDVALALAHLRIPIPLPLPLPFAFALAIGLSRLQQYPLIPPPPHRAPRQD